MPPPLRKRGRKPKQVQKQDDDEACPMDIDVWTSEPELEEPKPKRRRKTPIRKALRVIVWKNYFGTAGTGKCPVCNREIDCFNFECGHIVAEAKGGATNQDNLRPICSDCNRSMGTTDMREFVQRHFNRSI